MIVGKFLIVQFTMQATKQTKMYVRFDHIAGRDVIACDLSTGGTPGSPAPGGGFYRHAVGNGTDGTGNYYLLDGDLTSGVLSHRF